MFIFGNLVSAIAVLLDFAIRALMLVLLVNAVMSWVRPDPANPIVRFLERVSDLVCDPIRRAFPTVLSGLDFAPFIAMLALWFVSMFVVQSLHDLAARMG